jgi:outer membrane protein TolC
MRTYITLIFLCFFSSYLVAQQTTIGILKDGDSPLVNEVEVLVKNELTNLLQGRTSVAFKTLDGDWDELKIKNHLQQFNEDKEVGIIITLGIISSQQLSKESSFPKPSIAATYIENKIEEKTNIANFTYISPFIQPQKNIEGFMKMYPIDSLGIVYKGDWQLGMINAMQSQFNIIELIPIHLDSTNWKESVDAIYVFPQNNKEKESLRQLFATTNSKKIPSFSFLSEDINYGATVSYSKANILDPLSKKIALNVLKIIEGENASQLSILTNSESPKMLINMESVREINKLPEWESFENAVLLNLEKYPNSTSISVKSVISQALAQNLKGKKAVLSENFAEKNVQLAKSNLQPQVNISGTGVLLSENLVEASLGQRGEFTLSGNASLSQVLFSEPVLANIAIQKLLLESEKEQSRETTLDIVLEASTAYVAVLFAKKNLQFQSKNLEKTKTNLAIAEAKEKLGQSSKSDVNRWITELNINKMDVNQSLANYKSTLYQLNKILNQPIDKDYTIEEEENIDQDIILAQNELILFFTNELFTEKYADFLLEEMNSSSPEIGRLDRAIQLMERKMKSQSRRYYLPELVGFAGTDYTFLRNGVITNPRLPVPPPPDDVTWNTGFSLKFSVFEGSRKKHHLQQSKIEMEDLDYTKSEVLNNLEQGIRANTQKVSVSYRSVALSENAKEAAQKNFESVQEAYKQGVVDVTQLLDAQNVMLNTSLLATKSYYQYVLDYLQLERLTGKYNFLESATKQEEYNLRLSQFLLKK